MIRFCTRLRFPTCSSCRGPLSTPRLPLKCVACHKLQKLPPATSFFLLPGKETFEIDLGELRARFLGLQQQLHPDVSADKDLAGEYSAWLNEAYRVLRDPLLRAEYMLKVKQMGEAVPDDPDTLVQVMDVREQMSEAATADDIQALLAQNKRRMQAELKSIQRLFRDAEWQAARLHVQRLRYWTSINQALLESEH